LGTVKLGGFRISVALGDAKTSTVSSNALFVIEGSWLGLGQLDQSRTDRTKSGFLTGVNLTRYNSVHLLGVVKVCHGFLLF
jgi:hypothetical protein